MLSLIGNVALPEVLVIAAIAVIIFGRRLPEVAARVYGQFHKAREGLDRMRRESGIDRELREIQRNVQEASRRATVQDALQPPQGLTHAREASAPAIDEGADDVVSPGESESEAEAEEAARAAEAVREAGEHGEEPGASDGPVDRRETS